MNVSVPPIVIFIFTQYFDPTDFDIVIDFFDFFYFSIQEIVKTANFTIFKDIAQHNDALYSFLLEHKFEIFLGAL